jgi:hypothetical protein
LITSTAASDILTAISSNTSYKWINLASTGGNLVVGINNSAGGATMTTAAYASYIFTRNATNLVFGTNEVARLTIASTGNVGIGTTVPSGKLEVNGGVVNETSFGVNKVLKLSNTSVVNGSRIGIAFSNNENIGSSLAFLEAVAYNQSIGATSLQFSVYDGTSWWGDMMTLKAGNVGIGTTSPTSKLEVVGTITTTSLVETSSIKIKENVKTLDNPLDIIKKLRGVEYNRIGETYNEIGVIAEEVNDVLPQVVNKDEEGNPTSVSYGRLTALLIEVVKKQDEQIENLTKRIEELEK